MAHTVYCATNEDLGTIVKGLAPTPDDIILAVCGSGDQAFALASHGAKVICVDINEIQLDFFQSRLNSLGEGDIKSFLHPNLSKYDCVDWPEEQVRLRELRNTYFRNHDLEDKAEQTAGRISFEEGNIFDAILRYPQCNKIYLSNAASRFQMEFPSEVIDAGCAVSKQRGDHGPLYYDARSLYTLRSLNTKITTLGDKNDPFTRIHMFREIAIFFDRDNLSRDSVDLWTPATYRIVAE